MPIDTISIEEFIAQNKITMTATRTESNPNMDASRDMDHWKVTLKRSEETTQLRFATRDLGHGSEYGSIHGSWGETDTWGKRAFYRLHPFPGKSPVLYLFPDEISSEKKVTVSVASMTTTFSMGSGHKGAEPKAADVLDCLASDSYGADMPFSEWAIDSGYDPDSRKAEKIFNACCHTAARLKKFLGSNEAYETLLFGTERM